MNSSQVPVEGKRSAGVRSSLVEEIPGDGDLCAEVFRDADGGGFELMHEAGEVVARAGDGGDAEGGGLPGDGFVHFRDGDVETVGELFFQAADDLAAVLEGVGMLDTKFEEHGGNGHRKFILTLRADAEEYPDQVGALMLKGTVRDVQRIALLFASQAIFRRDFHIPPDG
jgi:hypothetical protein